MNRHQPSRAIGKYQSLMEAIEKQKFIFFFLFSLPPNPRRKKERSPEVIRI